MIEILVIGLIIYFWVINIKKKRNRPELMSSMQQTPVPSTFSAQPKQVLSSLSTRQGQTSNGSYTDRNTVSDTIVKQSEGASGSTTAYLNEKARQDAIEHAREEREEAMRLHKAYGGLRVAERLYLGDSIPQGRQLCVCGYCGAENLLPQATREQFCCYFCREPLG